jgi:hypothetical protein
MTSPGSSPVTGDAGPEPRVELELHADLELRAELRLTPGTTVLTGGQTGVDTLAARAALAAGLTVHMVFPHGFRQEDGPLTPERRAELHGAVLHQLGSAGFAQRTWTCVSLADAVILLDPAGGEGCRETIRAASHLKRPLLDLTARLSPPGADRSGSAGAAAAAVLSFLSSNKAQVLMFAGCRGTRLADQADAVRDLLEDVTAALAGRQDERPG